MVINPPLIVALGKHNLILSLGDFAGTTIVLIGMPNALASNSVAEDDVEKKTNEFLASFCLR